MVWMGMLAFAGGTKLVSVDYDATPVETPWGPMDKSYVRGACYASEAFIGKVVATRPYLRPMVCGNGTPCGDEVYTAIVFEVERMLRGAPDADGRVTLFVQGGTLGDRHESVSRHQPQPTVGHRYAVSYRRLSSAVYDLPAGTPITSAVFTVKPDLALPSVEVINAELASFCTEVFQ